MLKILIMVFSLMYSFSSASQVSEIDFSNNSKEKFIDLIISISDLEKEIFHLNDDIDSYGLDVSTINFMHSLWSDILIYFKVHIASDSMPSVDFQSHELHSSATELYSVLTDEQFCFYETQEWKNNLGEIFHDERQCTERLVASSFDKYLSEHNDNFTTDIDLFLQRIEELSLKLNQPFISYSL